MLSKRIANVAPSATMEFMKKVAEYRRKGEDIISFNVGEPDFQTPSEIIAACKAAMDEGKTKYVGAAGIPELREAICEKLKKDNQVEYTPDQISVSTGAKQAIYNAVMTLCDEGDEVIIPTPSWVSYTEIVKLAMGKPVLVPSNKDFSLDLQAIEAAITPRTKAILINTPNNPTGICYDKASLQTLGEMAVKYNFFIISDEIYEKLVYDGNQHISIASLSDEIYQKTITVNGLSKSHAMTGWRLGYSAAPLEISKGIGVLLSQTTSSSTTFVQWAAVEALLKCETSVEQMRCAFQERRDYLYSRLSNTPNIHCVKPGGAFYIMPDISAYFGKSNGSRIIRDADDFCDYMLDEAKIAVVPGTAFGMPNTVRFAYTDSLDRIKMGAERFCAALAQLR